MAFAGDPRGWNKIGEWIGDPEDEILPREMFDPAQGEWYGDDPETGLPWDMSSEPEWKPALSVKPSDYAKWDPVKHFLRVSIPKHASPAISKSCPNTSVSAPSPPISAPHFSPLSSASCLSPAASPAASPPISPPNSSPASSVPSLSSATSPATPKSRPSIQKPSTVGVSYSAALARAKKPNTWISSEVFSKLTFPTISTSPSGISTRDAGILEKRNTSLPRATSITSDSNLAASVSIPTVTAFTSPSNISDNANFSKSQSHQYRLAAAEILQDEKSTALSHQPPAAHQPRPQHSFIQPRVVHHPVRQASSIQTPSATQASAHEIPAGLRQTFDALTQKFQTDEFFQKSTLAYLEELRAARKPLNGCGLGPQIPKDNTDDLAIDTDTPTTLVHRDLTGMTLDEIVASFRQLEKENAVNAKRKVHWMKTAKLYQAVSPPPEKKYWVCNQINTAYWQKCVKRNSLWELDKGGWKLRQKCQECGAPPVLLTAVSSTAAGSGLTQKRPMSNDFASFDHISKRPCYNSPYAT